jgi:aryl-alcohol dehydrogenase-like predicted oxidoreductase
VSTVIMGASRVSQLQDNLGALEVLPKLSTELVARIEAITAPLAQ